jgi:GxxExxY protein
MEELMLHERITGLIIVASINVHNALGPGLLESAYLTCLLLELKRLGLSARSQVSVPIRFNDVVVDPGYRLDLLVEDKVIVELKAVEKLLPIHQAQLLTYLKLTGHEVGLLINFNVLQLKDGIKRMVNDAPLSTSQCPSEAVVSPR